jgi:hypothetical protein
VSAHTTAPGLLLGFTGRAGAGKDTCAQLLQAHGFASIAFGDALRAEVAEAWRIDLRMLTERATKEWPIEALAVGRCTSAAFVRAAWAAQHGTGDLESLEDAEAFAAWLAEPRSPRWVLQRWGTEYRRAEQLSYWVDIVARWVGRQREQALQAHRPALLCVTDVRFPNEAGVVRALGGHVVGVHRPELPTMADDTADHPSEQALPVSAEVHNDGDLDHLHAELARVIDTLRRQRRASFA